MSKLSRSIFLSVILLGFSSSALVAQQYFPETGSVAWYQRSLDLRSNLKVLVVSLQPGYEDLELMTYFRFHRGAQILSVYVTNGESGQHDQKELMPLSVAALRRQEATRVVKHLGGESRFLCMPELASASDARFVRSLWNFDSLRFKLDDILISYKPDIIVLSRDYASQESSVRLKNLSAEVEESAKRVSSKKVDNAGRNKQTWSVGRILYDDGTGKGMTVPASVMIPRLKMSVAAIAGEADSLYSSMVLQRAMIHQEIRASYRAVRAIESRSIARIDQDVSSKTLERVRSLERSIGNLADRVMKEQDSSLDRGRLEQYLKEIVSFEGTIEKQIRQLLPLNPYELRTMVYWREGLEDLRQSLLGVQLYARLSEDVLAERQVVYCTIDSLKGIDTSLSADLYFPFVSDGWYVNERQENRAPLKVGEVFRFLSPGKLPFDLPAEMYGMQKASLTNKVYLFLVQKGKTPERSVTYRKVFELLYAPRYTIEATPPIVRAGYTKNVTVRFTNHTYDGVRDTIRVLDSLANAPGKAFRASFKEASDQAFLNLEWRRPVEEGTWTIPVSIAGIKVSKFAARSFAVAVDTTKTIGIITALQASATLGALENLGLQPHTIVPDSTMKSSLLPVSTLIIDRRALTLQRDLRTRKKELGDFVRSGGHLIILAQDALSWNENPLIEGIQMRPSTAFDPQSKVQTDSLHGFLRVPNRIESYEWDDWIYQRASNVVTVSKQIDVSLPVRIGRSLNPGIVTIQSGRGKITYVDLDLVHQLMNVHPGAYRLLANLLSS
jgi:hypothetical protein